MCLVPTLDTWRLDLTPTPDTYTFALTFALCPLTYVALPKKISLMIRRALIASGAIFALLATLFLSAQQSPTSELETSAFVCPMHPDYTLDISCTCPRCGMALVRATPYDVRDYGFEFTTVPAIVRAGEPAQWRFRIFHPGTGQRVTKFESVHERQYHLFVISQDMQHFEHIHPVEQPDGTWTIDVTLPKAGYYKVLSDFLPSGGA